MSFLGEGSDPARRRTHWDVAAGLTNYLFLAGAQIASAALSFGSVWLAARALGPDGYGSVVALIAASQLVGQAAIQWTSIALFRHGCREFVDEGRIAGAFWNRLAVLAASFLLVLATAPWWLPRIGALFAVRQDSLGLVLLFLLSNALGVHAQQSLQAAKLPRFQSGLQVMEKGAIAIAIGGASLLGTPTLRTVALAFALSPLATTVLATWRIRHLVFPVAKLQAPILRQMLRFSYPLLFFSIVGYFTTNHLDAIFILRFLSASDLGVYALAYQVAGAFMQFPSLVGSLFMAFFITADAEGDPSRIDRFFRSVLPTLTLALSMIAAVAAAAGSLLLGAFFDDSFRGAPILLWPLMAAAAFAAPVTVAFGPAANARSRTSIAAVAAVVGALTNALLNYVLIPRFGLAGCAWATTAAFGASLLVFLLIAPATIQTSRSWTLHATLPMLLGAAVASTGRAWTGIVITLSTGVALGVLRRHDVHRALDALAALLGVESLRWSADAPRAQIESQ